MPKREVTPEAEAARAAYVRRLDRPYDRAASMYREPGEVTSRMVACVCGGSGFVRVHVPVGHPLFGEAVPCVCGRHQGSKGASRFAAWVRGGRRTVEASAEG